MKKNIWINVLMVTVMTAGTFLSINANAKPTKAEKSKKAETKMKDYKQPEYGLEARNNLSTFVVFVNDVPAFVNLRGMAYSMSVPINYLLKNGTNTITAKVFPAKKSEFLTEQSDFTATVIVKDRDQNPSEYVDAVKIEFPVGTSNEKNKLAKFTKTEKFEVKLPFKDYRWVTSPKLDKNKEASIEKAKKAITTFHQTLQSGDTKTIKNLIEPREQEMALAFYEPMEKGLAVTMEDFEGTLKDKNFVLQPLDLNSYQPKFYAEGRLITFENDKYKQAIYFSNKAEGTRREYPLYWCADGDELVLIR